MNRKGFTLVELIATVALLAVIAVIAFVSINRVVNKGYEKNCYTLVDNIVAATEEYVSDNRYGTTVNFDNYYARITTDTLVSGHYLNNDLINPKTKEPLGSINIDIYLHDDYTMRAVKIDSDELYNSCNYSYTSGVNLDYNPVEANYGDKDAPAISYSPEPKTYNVDTKVTISASDSGSGVDYMIIEFKKDGVKVSEEHIVGNKKAQTLDDGTWTIKTIAYDNAGNRSEKEETYVIDLSVATPTISNPTDGNWTNRSFALTLSTTSPNIVNWQYTYNKDASTTGSDAATMWVTYANSASSTFTTTDFSAARNQLVYVRACNSKKCSDKASTYIRIDKTLPQASYNLASGTFTETSKSVTITGSDTGGSGYNYMMVHVYKDNSFVEAKSMGNTTASTYTVNMDSVGVWNVYVQVFDKAGNKQNQTPANSDGWYYHTYELLAPLATPTISNPSGGNWTNSNFKLTLNIANSNIAYWQYTYNVNATTTGSDNTKNWVTYANSASSTFTTTSFSAEGERLVYVRACDAYRCSDKASTYIRIDKTAPTITFSWPAGTYNNSLGYTRLTVSDSGSGVDYWHFHLYKNNTFIENQSRSFVTDTDTTVFELNGYATWTAFGMVYDKAGNRQTDANTDGWAYRVYVLGTSSGGGGSGGGGGSCSFVVNNGYSGSYKCTGHKDYSSGRCNCIAHCDNGTSTQNPC